ncbi:MAG: GIY-YIG nuclease family protein [Ignavibacteriaceae bacterium]
MYYYVCLLKSENFKETFYTGFTTKLKERLSKHNNGEVPHILKFKPWKKNVISFTDNEKALAFEKYLKSHSGRVFAK